MDSPRAFGNTVCSCLRLTICSRTCHLGWVKTLGVKPTSQRHAGQRQRRTAIILTTKWLFLAAAVVAGALELFFPARALAVPATLLDDSYTTSAKPFSTPAGSQPTIVVSPKTTGFVQFDLSTLPAGTQAGDVAKASLTLYVSAGSVKSPGSFSVKAVAGAWDELTLNQANAPALGAAIGGNVAVAAADGNQFIQIDVTTVGQAQRAQQERPGRLVRQARPGRREYRATRARRVPLALPERPAPRGTPVIPGQPARRDHKVQPALPAHRAFKASQARQVLPAQQEPSE